MKYQYECDLTYDCHSKYVRLLPGCYIIECYGAQGGTGLTNGNPSFPGGPGAYTSGILCTKKSLPIYLYIGGKGEDANKEMKIIRGGWNGGGNGDFDKGDDDHSAAGGGATDVRLIGGEWNSSESLQSRIMVAAGGSGSAYDSYGAPGGDLTGYVVNDFQSQDFVQSTTSQIEGNQLGIGENGHTIHGSTVAYSGGGSGYYGGKTRDPLPTSEQGYNGVSSSGSSYISGFPGCHSVSKEPDSKDIHIHSSGYFFHKPVMINGFSLFPSLNDDSNFVKGNEGNGGVKISLLSNLLYITRCKREPTWLTYYIFVIIM